MEIIVPEYDGKGGFVLNERYQEIKKLSGMLVEAGIPHTIDRLMDGWQIIYPEDGASRVMDAIEHFGSYGSEEDLLEIMGLLTDEEKESDSVLGHLTAEEVFQRIQNHYLGKKPKKSKRKYRKGEQITSIQELIKQEFIYCHDKLTHHGWFMSWQLRFAKDLVERGVLFKAVKEGE